MSFAPGSGAGGRGLTSQEEGWMVGLKVADLKVRPIPNTLPHLFSLLQLARECGMSCDLSPTLHLVSITA
jgi:hypothetical protein